METEQPESNPAAIEFNRRYDQIQRERGIPSMLGACRENAIFQTVEKYTKYLDRVLVQKLKDGRIDLTYQVFHDLFVDPKDRFFWETISSGPPKVVDPHVTFLDAETLQNILHELSVKAKAGVLGKIILMDGYFYFTWKSDDGIEVDGEDDILQQSCVVHANNFDSAVNEMKEKISTLTAKYFQVYYDGKWRGIELLHNGLVANEWLHKESKNFQFIEKK